MNIHLFWQRDISDDSDTNECQQEVFPPGSADTVCPRRPLMTRVQH